jgi:hypothetical protein
MEYRGLFVIITIANLRLQAYTTQNTCIINCKGEGCAKRNNGDIRYLFDQNKILVDKISERV